MLFHINNNDLIDISIVVNVIVIMNRNSVYVGCY